MEDGNLFYIDNKERLFAYLLRMTGNHDLACDLVQESFARYLARYGNNGHNRPLLFTIARNAALDAFRRQHVETGCAEDHEDSSPSPEQHLMERQAFERMLAAIGQLKQLDRDLISLVVTADLTYQEIGKILKVSEANVKVKVHRARLRLKTLLRNGGR